MTNAGEALNGDTGRVAAPGKKRAWLRRVFRFVLACLVIIVLLALFWLRGAIYNRFVRFPREQAAWSAIRAQTRAVTNTVGWTEYRGILHTHSHLSHDCEVPFEDIMHVLKGAHLDFVCLSDHCDEGRADFSAQWRGMRDGKLFIPGFEMRHGFMPFGVASGTILSNTTERSVLARQIVENGGLLFYAHSEEERDWDRPELAGMEIYNIHVDFKRSRGFSALLPDLLVNHRKYPEQIIHSISRRPVEFLKRWDDLNRTRHITGIGANDCHQNAGIRVFYTEAGDLRIEDTSPEVLKELRLNWLTRPLARLAFGPLEPGRKLFHFQLDPYERMARLINTHVLARELSEPAILDALKAGRAFAGFDMIADSSGFRFYAEDGETRAVMGESIPYARGMKLKALSPVPCRLSIVSNGEIVFQQQGYEMEWAPDNPAKYRVEAELQIRGEWVPWVYANPIELRAR